nr:hypothetical protein [Salinispora arenicola]
MGQLTDAVLSNATAAEIAAAPLPEEYFAAHLRVEDATMFEGVVDKDVRKSLRLGHVPMPELAPDEVPHRGDGERGQLQHGVVGDVRADVQLPLSEGARPAGWLGETARPTLPRRRLRPAPG